MNIISLQDYQAALEKHDWYYDFSDDGGVYRAGVKEENRLREISRASDDHLRLWDAWKAHQRGNASQAKERQPRPTLELLGLIDKTVVAPAVEPVVEMLPDPPAVIEVAEMAASFPTALSVSASEEEARAYVERRIDDAMKLSERLFRNNMVIASSTTTIWKLRCPLEGDIRVESIVDGDDMVAQSFSFKTLVQAKAYILAKWW